MRSQCLLSVRPLWTSGKYFAVLIAGLLGLTQAALAQDISLLTDGKVLREPVDVTHLRIIGRGIEDHRTGEIIVLACAGKSEVADGQSDCSAIRHVGYNKKTGQAYFMGDLYKSESVTEDADSISRNFKSYKRRENKQRNLGRMVLITIGGGFLIYASPFFLPIAMPVATAGLFLNWGISIPIIYQYGINGKMISSTATTTEAFVNQDGWNWAFKPRKVNHRTFEQYQNFIDHRRTMTASEYGHKLFERDRPAVRE